VVLSREVETLWLLHFSKSSLAESTAVCIAASAVSEDRQSRDSFRARECPQEQKWWRTQWSERTPLGRGSHATTFSSSAVLAVAPGGIPGEGLWRHGQPRQEVGLGAQGEL